MYHHKLLSTIYSMLLLRRFGLATNNYQACLACKVQLEGGFQSNGSICFSKTAGVIDNGVTAMVLTLLAYFSFQDERLPIIVDYLLKQQAADGSWQPQPDNEQMRYTYALLKAKRNRDGSGNLQNRHAGKKFFEMEVPGKSSRWNTFRAFRVLEWWENN